jgi:hypothetical protein
LLLVPCRSKIKPRLEKYLLVKLKEKFDSITEDFERVVLSYNNVHSLDFLEGSEFDYIMSVVFPEGVRPVSRSTQKIAILGKVGDVYGYKNREGL